MRTRGSMGIKGAMSVKVETGTTIPIEGISGFLRKELVSDKGNNKVSQVSSLTQLVECVA